MMFIIFTHLQKRKNHKYVLIAFLINFGRLVNKKEPRFRTQSSKSCIKFPKNIAHDQINLSYRSGKRIKWSNA